MAQQNSRVGAWVIVIDGKIIIENSELRALRSAAGTTAIPEFVEWGHAVGEVTDFKPSISKARKPKDRGTTSVQPVTGDMPIAEVAPTPDAIVAEVDAEAATVASEEQSSDAALDAATGSEDPANF